MARACFLAIRVCTAGRKANNGGWFIEQIVVGKGIKKNKLSKFNEKNKREGGKDGEKREEKGTGGLSKLHWENTAGTYETHVVDGAAQRMKRDTARPASKEFGGGEKKKFANGWGVRIGNDV